MLQKVQRISCFNEPESWNFLTQNIIVMISIYSRYLLEFSARYPKYTEIQALENFFLEF